MKKVRETPPTSKKGVFSCVVAEEKVVVNNKYPEQTINIGRQLPEHFKGRKKEGAWAPIAVAACKEVKELTKAGILRKVKHQTWVANPVMVKKSDGGWRMCVDFTYINKACPKDCYPLPEIDWKVESLSGF
ncbi:hypothetical protein Tco_0554329 [Tanacetum coccineum]